jgi:hypothetical protein
MIEVVDFLVSLTDVGKLDIRNVVDQGSTFRIKVIVVQEVIICLSDL